MKKFVMFATLATVLTIFNGCQKDEQVLIDEQLQNEVKPDVYVENGYLVFENFEALDSLKKLLNNSSNETLIRFEASKRLKLVKQSINLKEQQKL